jgi:hypothetical protein
VETGDFNGDGRVDLAVFGGVLSVFTGKGDGTFTGATNTTIGYSTGGVVGDFNGDGKLDVAFVTRNYDSLAILLGNGNGTFQSAVNYADPSGPGSVTVGDFNGDGKLDVAVANANSDTIGVFLGNGNGSFQSQVTYTVQQSPGPIVVGDFNGDGKPDLAVASQRNNSLEVLLGNGNGTFQAPRSFSVPGLRVYSLAAVDFNGDGVADLVACDVYGVDVFLANGDGTFADTRRYDVAHYNIGVAVGNFKGDGVPDLAVASPDSGGISIVLNSSIATATALTSSVDPSVFGQPVTFTATVSAVPPGSGTPTGTVTFKDNGVTLATSIMTGGSATFLTSSFSAGTHRITAVYGSDTNFFGSTSGTLSQTVKKDGTTATVVSSANPAPIGRNVKFTATISAVAPGSGTPTGTVTFLDGATTLATAKLNSGQATFATSTLAKGVHGITVTYGGNVNFTGSTSSTLSQTIRKDATTTVVASSLNPSTSGQTVIFTATVTANAPGSGVPTGKVTFLDGTTTLGFRSLNSGKATFTTSSLSVGQHSISVVYAGSSSDKPSTSATLTQTVNAAGQLLIAGQSAAPTSANARRAAIVAPAASLAPARYDIALVPGGGQGSCAAMLHVHWSAVPGRVSDTIPLLDLMTSLDQLFAEPGHQSSLSNRQRR